MMYNAFWIRVTDILSASFFGKLLLNLFFHISCAFKNSWLYSFFVSRNMKYYADSSRIVSFLRKIVFQSKLTECISDSIFTWFWSDYAQNYFASKVSALSLFIIPASVLMFVSEFGSVVPMIISATIMIIGLLIIGIKTTIADILNKSFFFVKLFEIFDIEISRCNLKPLRTKAVLLISGFITGISSAFLDFKFSLLVLIAVLILPFLLESPLLLISLSFLVGISFSSLPAFVCCFLTAIVVFCRLITNKEKLPTLRAPYIIVSLYAIVVLFFTFFCSSGSASFLAGFLQFVLLSLFFSSVVVINDFDKFTRLLNILTVFSLVPAFVGLFQFFTGAGGTGWSAQNHVGGLVRIVSTFSNPNVFGEFILVSFGLSVASFLISRGWKLKIFFAFCTGLQLVNLVITYSRGCYLACLAAALIIIWCCDKRILSFTVFALPILPKILPQNMLARIMTVGSYLKDTSVLYRFSIWKGALRIVKNHWYFASGIGTVAFSMFYRNYMFAGTPAQHSHNTYIQLAVEIGIIGLTVFLMLYFFIIKDICNVVSKTNISSRFAIIPLFSTMVAMLVQSFFDYVFYNNIVFMSFWIVVALLICALNITSNDISFKNIEENINDEKI